MTPKARAEKSAAIMWDKDEASKWFGMKLETVGPGSAEMSLTIQSQHLNGAGICHGGVIFALADSCFAYACNSYNQQVVAQHNSITYLAPGAIGSQLTASAHEISVSGRSGLYDVKVIDQSGKIIAAFRGASRRVRGSHFDNDQ